MAMYHDREALLRDVRNISAKMLEDGILIDCPKDRRRKQAMSDDEQLPRVKIPKDIKKRFCTQINRYVEKFGKGLGWDTMMSMLEAPPDEQLDAAAREDAGEHT